MSLSTGVILNNRYRIVRRVGQGGFGAVYRAWDITLSRPCAIKENLEGDPAAQAQFEREAIMLANLIHPNLARVNDYFFIPDQGQYFVMDFVEGKNLEELASEGGGGIDVTQALTWIGQVLEALEYLHSQHPPIIHRDIKPANIRINPQGRAILVDFGIAKRYDPATKTTVGARAVTPGYSPAEQYGRGRTDARSDLYALGATLYTLLTGAVPPESIDILSGQASPPEPASQLNPQVPATVSAAIQKSMQVRSDERFNSAAEFREAIKAGSGAAVSDQQSAVSGWPSAVGGQQAAVSGAAGREQSSVVSDQSSVGSGVAVGGKAAGGGAAEAESGAGTPVQPLGGGMAAGYVAAGGAPAEGITPKPEFAAPKPETAAPPVGGVSGWPVEAAPPQRRPNKRRRILLLVGIPLFLLCTCSVFTYNWLRHSSFSLFAPVAQPAQPAPTQALPEPTQAPAATEPPAPTEPPVVVETVAPAISGTVSIWLSIVDNAEGANLLSQIHQDAHAQFADLTITTEFVPYDEIHDKVITATASGSAPDLLITDPSFLTDWVAAGSVRALDDWEWEELSKFNPRALEMLRRAGALYGLPLAMDIVALYSRDPNLSITTTDELLQAVSNGSKLVSAYPPYFLYGFFGAFGAQVLDGDGRCVADQTGGERALVYLLALQSAGAEFLFDGDPIGMFNRGEAALIIDGTWNLKDYTTNIGEGLTVTSLPQGPGWPAHPLLGVPLAEYVNPQSGNPQAVQALAQYLASAPALKSLADSAYLIPARWDAKPADPNQVAFASAALNGDSSMSRPEFSAYWVPFFDLFTQVLQNGADPAQALADACAKMNGANGK